MHYVTMKSTRRIAPCFRQIGPKIVNYKGREVIVLSGVMGNVGKICIYITAFLLSSVAIIGIAILISNPGILSFSAMALNPIAACSFVIMILMTGSLGSVFCLIMIDYTIHRLEMKPIPSKEISQEESAQEDLLNKVEK